jgi:hypothetical protein
MQDKIIDNMFKALGILALVYLGFFMAECHIFYQCIRFKEFTISGEFWKTAKRFSCSRMESK